MPLDISYHFPHGFKGYYFSWDHVINKKEQELGETLNEILVIHTNDDLGHHSDENAPQRKLGEKKV